MPRCVGTTVKGIQCRVSAVYHCATCDAYLCSWHVVWDNGAWCPWCKVRVRGRAFWWRGGVEVPVEREPHENVDR